jgi:hypothetical protein
MADMFICWVGRIRKSASKGNRWLLIIERMKFHRDDTELAKKNKNESEQSGPVGRSLFSLLHVLRIFVLNSL